MARTQVYRDDTPMTERLGRFVALLVILGGLGFGAVVAAKFNAETLALITGLLIAGIPLLAVAGLAGYIAIKATARQPRQQMPIAPQPIILQMPMAQPQPQALPDNSAGYTWDLPQRQTANAGRQWDTLGDD